MVDDPHRPRYHFLPPANWMNDPNGLIQWKGQYHLFYQYNPHGPYHGTIHWGHAVSDDLVHWQNLPIALAPTSGGPDEQGCWSGCAVDNQGVPTLIYTGVFPQVVCLATSSDDLLTWEKYAGNPVIATPPPELQTASGGHFRDPYVWKANSRWYMVMGTKIEGEGGLVLLYQSQDLLHWEYLHPILRSDVNHRMPFWTGSMWECPNLLDFGDRQALIVSAQAAQGGLLYAFYASGTLNPDGLAVCQQDILVHGGLRGCFYAPQAMHLDDGRYVLWGWLREGRSNPACLEAGWSGAMSLPLEVSLQASGALFLNPVVELQALRGQHWHDENVELADGVEERLTEIESDSLEIRVELEAGSQAEAGFKLRCSPDNEEYTQVMVQQAEQRVAIKRDQSSLSSETDRDLCVAPLQLHPGQTVRLHIFLDRSILEVFVNGGQTALASRIYPVRSDSLGVSLFSRDGTARIKSLDVWTLKSIW